MLCSGRLCLLAGAVLLAAPTSAWSNEMSLSLRRQPSAQSRTAVIMAATTTGLEYEEIIAGTGTTPTIDSSVTVHYTGKLAADGRVFDSSYSRGEPTTFKVNQVIQGWQEGLQLMKEVCDQPAVDPVAEPCAFVRNIRVCSTFMWHVFRRSADSLC